MLRCGFVCLAGTQLTLTYISALFGQRAHDFGRPKDIILVDKRIRICHMLFADRGACRVGRVQPE